jgi:hypothetical protein
VKPLGSEVMRFLLLIALVWSSADAAFAQNTAAAEPPPLAAKFSVSTSSTASTQTWYLFRDAQRIAVLKDDVEEAWHRDAQGRIRFERVFHHERQAVDYSPGELAALRVDIDWVALASFVDPQEMATLKPVSRNGQGPNTVQRLQGQHGGQTLRVDWLPALQLPALISRQTKVGDTRITLIQHTTTAPATWPQPGQRSANYLRFDAADFGDMPYEAVVRKSEAIDIRAGWRAAHNHD